MKTIFSTALLALFCAILLPAVSVSAKESSDTLLIPERAIMLGDGRHSANAANLVAVLYDRTDLHYQDPSAPRFMFLDREGKVALGIGGYVKGTLQYDFDGAIDDGANFTTYDIPVPSDPGLRNQYYANINQSTIFLQLVGHSQQFGTYQVYVQTNFSGDGNNGYGLKLKQAWLSVGYIRVGLARSAFQDGEAGLMTIDDQGPCGEVSMKDIQLQYTPKFNDRWRGGIAVEMPKTSYTTNDKCEAIKQRVPDIPAFIQFGYGTSHVRLSAIWRNLSYRDLAARKNHFVTGYGVQLTGVTNVVGDLTLRYQGVYGKGIGAYLNDLSGNGFDLIPSGNGGKMKAAEMMGLEAGLNYDFTESFFMSCGYSRAQLFGQRQLGPDTYRYAQYWFANANWNITKELQVGLEYLHGSRHDVSGLSGKANRIEAMLQYTF